MRSFLLIALVLMQIRNQNAYFLPEEFKPSPVGKSLYYITGTGCNVVFWVTAKGIVVVDSGEKPLLSDKLLNSIKEISEMPIRYLVFTHHHHTGGANGFPESTLLLSHHNVKINIPIFWEITVDLLENNILDLKKKMHLDTGLLDSDSIRNLVFLRQGQLEAVRNQKNIEPHITFHDSLNINLSGQEVRLFYWGPGHTNGDIIVYFPAEKVVCTGDLLFTNGWIPRLDGDAGSSIENWLNIFDKLNVMDFQILIPGHGSMISKDEFRSYADFAMNYLNDLQREVIKYIAEGYSLQYIRENLHLPKYEDSGMAIELLSWNINAAYNEIVNYK
ncbi:MAG: MBL fold metallo-hydrolase [Bacteroidales bacterium]|nr:MBL fold metallo-hydrolase [Bacteroidales bacterium]